MAFATPETGHRRAHSRWFDRTSWLFVFGALLLALGVLAPDPYLATGLITGAGTLVLVAVLARLREERTRRRALQSFDLLRELVERDAVPCLITDIDGAITNANDMAHRRFGRIEPADCTLASLLHAITAEPGPVLLRLQSRIDEVKQAQEDVVARNGHARISVTNTGVGYYLWRVEEFPDRKEKGDLAAAPALPMLTAGRNGTILSMNEAARKLVGTRAKTLDRLFVDLPPKVGKINVITTTEGAQHCLVAEAGNTAGRHEYYLLPTPTDAAPATPATPEFGDLPVPLLKVAMDGEVLHANSAALRLLGAESTVGESLSSLMEGLGRPIRDWLKEAGEGRDLNRTEFLRLKRADRETFVQVTLSRVKNSEDNALYVVLNDATELKTLEAQFVQSQKMQAIGQLAGGVAHDFNNLLTAISGHCDLLLLRHDQGDGDYADLVQINQNANRAAALVSQLLAFSRKQTLQPEVLDVRQTMSDLTHLLNRLVGEKVELVLSHDPMLQTMRADKRQLEQVMMNLVVNARDAMPEGGQITVETENLTLDAPLTRDRAVVPAGEYVSVKVTDEGVGIPPEKLQKVFEPFFTTKRTGEGTGLGLSTVYGIVKQTGGFIFVDSVPGTGSSFSMLFPVFRQTKTVTPPMPQPAEPRQSSSRKEGVVLLVEDEAPVRAFASRALRLRGYTVLEADCAEAALETLSDEGLNVDVFVTDVVMPGMDGPSWVRQALQKRPDTRVVFVSGYAEEAFGDDQVGIPNSVFLPKPFSLNELTETVNRQIV